MLKNCDIELPEHVQNILSEPDYETSHETNGGVKVSTGILKHDKRVEERTLLKRRTF